MKKYIISALVIVGVVAGIFLPQKSEQPVGADSSISNLTALTSPTDSDLLVIVDNSGTPTTKKITRGNFFSTSTANLFATNASVSSKFEVAGIASVSSLYVGGTIFSTAGFLQTSGGTMTGDLFGTNASFSGNFEVGGIASVSGITYINSGNLHLISGGGGNLLGLNFDNGSNASSRRWQIKNDDVAFGDFSIKQSTTQSGTTYSRKLGISASGNVIVDNSASISANFEVGSYASVSQFFGGNASHQFSGSLSGRTTGTLSVGTSDNPLKILWSNIIKSVVQFFFPTYTGTSLSGVGNAAINTASASLDFNDGTNTKVLDGRTCFTYVVDSPTASNPGFVGPIYFDDPFTITSVGMVATGSNAAGWTLKYGKPGTITTAVFTSAHSASTSTSPIYTTFANSTLTDSMGLEVVLTSRSATLQSFSVTACGRYNH